MRWLWSLLFVGFAAVVVASFALAPQWGWWMPAGKSAFAPRVDALIHTIGWVMGSFFVLTLGLLAWMVARHGAGSGAARSAVDSDARLELLWSIVPAGVLAWLAWMQIDDWKAMKFANRAPGLAPIAQVWASQFDWRVRYPGPDGRLGNADDWEWPYELVVPADQALRIELRSRDVIHSFFVPAFRLKQDIVPGRAIDVWFEAQAGAYDLVCAELCGWGHYKMAGKVRVLPRAEYEQWIQAREAEQRSGAELKTR